MKRRYGGGHLSPVRLDPRLSVEVRHRVATGGCRRTGASASRCATPQILAQHADPRTTEQYDRARGNLDRHGVHFLTAYVAGV